GAPRRDLTLEFMPLPAQLENLPLKRRLRECLLLCRRARLRLLFRRFGTGPHGRSVKTIRHPDPGWPWCEAVRVRTQPAVALMFKVAWIDPAHVMSLMEVVRRHAPLPPMPFPGTG